MKFLDYTLAWIQRPGFIRFTKPVGPVTEAELGIEFLIVAYNHKEETLGLMTPMNHPADVLLRPPGSEMAFWDIWGLLLGGAQFCDNPWQGGSVWEQIGAMPQRGQLQPDGTWKGFA